MASDESASESDSEDGLFYHKGPVNAEWSDEEPKNAFAAGQNLSDSSDDDENENDDDDDDGLMLSQRHARTRMKKRGRDSCTATPPPKTSEETPTSVEKRRAATVASARASASAENLTASTSRAAASSRASALLSAVDELARPPSPVFLSPTVAAVEEEDNEESDSDSVREFGLEDRSDDDDNDDDSDSRDPLDDFDEGELITIQFQLPTGKKYARKVGIKSTFTSIMCNWKASDDWDIVASALGSPNVVLFFDGESISANATPEDLDLEDDDTVDVAVGKKAAKAW